MPKEKKKIDIKQILGEIKDMPELRPGISSMQESIPIYAVHEKENLIEVFPGYFVKSYYMRQINYMTASEEEQENILMGWRDVYNSLGDAKISLTTINKTVNINKICDQILLKETGDSLDPLRRDYNKITLDRIRSGNNGISQQHVLTVGIRAKSLHDAENYFKRTDNEMNNYLKKLGSGADIISMEEKLEILHDIYNYGHEGEFLLKTKVLDENGDFEEISSFDLENLRSMGLDVKDIISGACFNVYEGYLEIGDKYCMALQVTGFANTIKDSFYHDISDQTFNLITTLNVNPMPQSKARQLLNNQLKLIREEKHNRQQQNMKNNVDPDNLPLRLIEREEEIVQMLTDLSKNDERLYQTSLTVLLFADTLEEIRQNRDTIITAGRKASMTIEVIRDLQEEGFITALPLCYDLSNKKRTMKTTSAAMFCPFSNIEMNDPDGIVYSQNAISKNIVSYDRMAKDNVAFTGFIFGITGSGKSFFCKQEQIQYRLKGYDVIVIDPEGEYGNTAKLLGGQVINLKPASDTFINPLDIVVDKKGIGDPVREKADFIAQLVEIILDNPFGVNSVQRVILDEEVRNLYKSFYDKNGILRPIARNEMPTLTDLQRNIASRPEPEAREISYALKLYSGDGSLNIFGHQTNVDIDNQYLVFNILELGDGNLKKVAMFILMNQIWSRVIANRKRGKYTYLAIDEFHLLLQSPVTAVATQGFWKRFRKFGGIPTGITQNISDLANNEIGQSMLTNSAFMVLLNQQAEDRALAQNYFHLSENMLGYITNGPKGQGLIIAPSKGISAPFYSPFPKDNLVYRAITSDLRDIQAYEEAERKAELTKKEKERKILLGT